jgi:acetate kinase
MRVLVVNAGSSTLKLTLLDAEDAILGQRELAAPRAAIDDAELRAALDGGLDGADVVGHRIVHGGERYRDAVLIDAGVEAALRDLTELAPLHQPKSLAALDAVSAALPRLPAVACFDTAFHSTLPDAAATYALPAAWRERWQLRRFGFHGLSHAWVARRAPALLARSAAGLRVVSCHLGAGASLCAIADGRYGCYPGPDSPQASSPTPSSTTRDCRDLRGAPTCARCSRAPATATPTLGWRSTSICTA